MRLFIGALIPEEIRKQLLNYINSLKSHIDGVKWEKSDKLHITLKFLGDVEDSNLDNITNLLKRLVEESSSFKFRIAEFGGFPNLNNPKVLYMGLSENREFLKFQKKLDQGLCELGFEKEHRRFIPHITLGRVKKKINIMSSQATTHSSFEIVDIGLICSELRPKGSVYTPVKTYKLEK
ncbi:MAG: RNA 2',3'-cyclic phosphodiesterase [Thermodesulfobacteriota bacterium]|nr:MAG: RNA 2',3'-cyclic phosphodiesterase [Thermodesulfobacteriota bacterium]